MNNKKSVHALHWDILAFSALISIGIIVFHSSTSASIPQVGKFPVDLSKELERSNFFFQTIDIAAKETVKQSIAELTQIGVFIPNPSCKDHLDYKVLKGKNIDACFKSGDQLKNEFMQIFQNKMLNIKLEQFDLSNVDYKFSINDGEKTIVKGETDGRLETPLIMEKGRQEVIMGKVFLNPSFISYVNHDFNEVERLSFNVKELYSGCEDSKSRETCVSEVKRKFFDNEDFHIVNNCESEDKEEFYEFVEYFESCASSEIQEKEATKGCPCRNKPHNSLYNIKKIGDNVEITSKVDGEDFTFIVEDINQNLDEIKLFGEKILHKDIDGNLIDKIDFNLDARSCKLKEKTKFRICAKSNNNQYHSYDSDGNRVLKAVTYKFALEFEEKQGTEQLTGLYDRNIIIDSDCKTLDLAKKLTELLGDSGAQVILATSTSKCSQPAPASQYLSPTKSNLFILLNTEDIEKGVIKYNTESKEGIGLPLSILDNLVTLSGFSNELIINEELPLDAISTYIAIPDNLIKVEEDINQYAAAISSGVTDYQS